MVAAVDPTWIIAAVTAGGAALGAYRWYRRAAAKRRTQQREYRFLWQTVFGKPALHDESGVEYEEAELGIYQRQHQLEGAFYGHTSHPPHPARRASDRAP